MDEILDLLNTIKWEGEPRKKRKEQPKEEPTDLTKLFNTLYWKGPAK